MTEIPTFYPTFPTRTPKREDVVGQAKEFIDTLEETVDNSQIYYSLGISPDKTFILNSKPGLGKTHCINALNNSKNEPIRGKLEEIIRENQESPRNTSKKKINFRDFNLMLFEYDIGKYGTAYVNMGSRIINEFFNTAFKYSSYGIPILISVDECDSLFMSRRMLVNGTTEDTKVINTLMQNLQKSHDLENIYVVLMTNLPEHLDEASMRAGRIDRRVTFDMPGIEERKHALNSGIEKINKKAGYKVIRNVNLKTLSEITNGFNYADIFQSIEGAIRIKARDLIRTKEPGIIRAGYVTQKRLEKAILNHKKEFKNKSKKNKIGFCSN
jgi:ATP-dependent 26S proteasome regulatory subunit